MDNFMDLTPIFNESLRAHDARPVQSHEFDIDNIDSFLREAYRINKGIYELTSYLRSIRQSYLSTARAPPRQRKHNSTHIGSHHSLPSSRAQDTQYLSDTERNQIDAETTSWLRELNAKISSLTETEEYRQQIEAQVARRKRDRLGLGQLGRWAAGGALVGKSPEELQEEEGFKFIKQHRESIIIYLRKRQEEALKYQSGMMEVRRQREVEKSKSMLYKVKGPAAAYAAGLEDYVDTDAGKSKMKSGGFDAAMEANGGLNAGGAVEQMLSPEQLQLFQEENQGMLKHYEDQLDQIRHVDAQLASISDLQTQLAANLSVQAANIDQLVADSIGTEQNVGRGNKELKRASERRSTAQMVFWATVASCSFLVVWDLIF